MSDGNPQGNAIFHVQDKVTLLVRKSWILGGVQRGFRLSNPFIDSKQVTGGYEQLA